MNKPLSLNVLIIEDSIDDAELIVHELKRADFDISYKRIDTQLQMDEAFKDKSWDIVLSDFHMPQYSGLQALADFKKRNLGIPFIFVSGVMGEDAAVAAIKSGANDYVMKNNLKHLPILVERALQEAKVYRERVHAEQAFRKSEERYRQIIETTSEGVWMLDENNKTTFLNKQMATMLASTVLAMQGVSPFDFLDEIGVEKLLKTLERNKQGSPDQVELKFYLNGKVNFWAWCSLSPILDEHEKVVGTLLMVSDITKRKTAEDDVKSALHEKEILLEEVYHRVKNNMQVIYSLFNLQRSQSKDPAADKILKECADRIKSMALVHEKLYRSRNLAEIDFADYVQTLMGHLFYSYGIKNENIVFKNEVKPILLDVSAAIPVSLITNELVSNALKHAFKNKVNNIIKVELNFKKPEELALTVDDNGISFPESIDPYHPATPGLQLILTLVKQLNGEIFITRNKGTQFCVVFPYKKIR